MYKMMTLQGFVGGIILGFCGFREEYELFVSKPRFTENTRILI